jgi:MFS family permease
MTTAVLVLLFVGQLGLSPAQLGLSFVASSLSSLVGSLVIRPLQGRAGVGPVMVLATVLLAIGAALRVGAAFTHGTPTFPLLVASSLVAGFGLMTYNVPQQAIRQAAIPDRLLGRTSAGVALAVNAASVAGSLAGGLLGQLAGLRWTLAAAAAITALCVLPTAIGPLGTLRDVPASTDESAKTTARP